MRLFIAINLSDTVKDKLSAAVNELKKKGVSGNFSLKDNLHLTLAFIGETNRLNDVTKAAEKTECEKFAIDFGELGVFRRSGGDILWVGIYAGEPLLKLQKKLTRNLTEAGFKLDDREYSPHLTLCRETFIPQSLSLPSVNVNAGRLNVDFVSLMKSERINGRLAYTEIYRKVLT